MSEYELWKKNTLCHWELNYTSKLTKIGFAAT